VVIEKVVISVQELRKQCQDFATALLDHTRSSYELEVLLNHDPTGPAFEHGERMHLNRLKLAIKLRQKKVSYICPFQVSLLIYAVQMCKPRSGLTIVVLISDTRVHHNLEKNRKCEKAI
jgi:hypothetical protein